MVDVRFLKPEVVITQPLPWIEISTMFACSPSKHGRQQLW